MREKAPAESRVVSDNGARLRHFLSKTQARQASAMNTPCTENGQYNHDQKRQNQNEIAGQHLLHYAPLIVEFGMALRCEAVQAAWI